MIEDRLSAIKAQLAAATPGPWHLKDSWTIECPDCDAEKTMCQVTAEHEDGTEYLSLEVFLSGLESLAAPNAALIADAPEHLAWLCTELEQARARIASHREFFQRCWDGARGVSSEPDGRDIQEWAKELGLLEAVRVEAPCGEGCVCEECDADFPTDCYRPVARDTSSGGSARMTEDRLSAPGLRDEVRW